VLAELTGQHEQNSTLDLSCRDVFRQGSKPINVLGTFPEVEEAVISVHKGYWS
jgi:hypothetical protein